MTSQTQIAITLLSLVLIESLAVVTFAHQTFSSAYKKAEEARTHFLSRADNLAEIRGTKWVVNLAESLYRRRLWLALIMRLCRWGCIVGLIAVASQGLWLYLMARPTVPLIVEDYLLPYTTYILLALAVLFVILIALTMLEREKTRIPEATLNEPETPPEEG